MYSKSAVKFIVYIFATIGFVLTSGYFAVQIGLTNEQGIIDNQRAGFLTIDDPKTIATPLWINSEEWTVLKKAITRDAVTIYKASYNAGVNPRLLVSVLVPEQLRLFYSEREIFKKIFAPLQILGNQNQFSWGIMGIKQETAKEIESNLKNQNSIYYLGKENEKLLDFNTEDINQERFQRLIDEKDHYYSYFYAALYIRQIISGWQKSGYNIINKPEIIGTLYNIGFTHSNPKENPQVGGSSIKLNNKEYSFGNLTGEFYHSNELEELFPKN